MTSSPLNGVALLLPSLADCRPLPPRSPVERVRLAALALAAGAAFGIGNFAANYGMAVLDPAIHLEMAARFARFTAASTVIRAPVVEEVGFRLILMTGLAWILARLTDDRRTIFAVALVVSATIFGVAHVSGIQDPGYVVGMVAKSTVAGVILGWIFWRWGLAYAMLCHSAANGIHTVLMPLFP